MSDTQESTRQRTAARMRFVAPPGMSLTESGRKTIGRYEVIRTLGKGAMGVVYKARDPLLDRVVAVKTIVSPRGGSKRVHAAYIERFKREAKAAAKMQHPSIVTIYDVGIDDEEAPFMVLEYLPGETLADRLDRVRLPLGRAVQIGMDLANALAFAHRQRIVHRDVKPANVLHAGDNRWKLADFGIARLPDSDLTQVGIFMGTPGYSPPEAIRFGHYTPQADVFAWGAVLYEMLSGRIPYEGPDTRTTNSYVIKATASSPRTYDPSIPEPLADVIMAALNPSAADRYKDGAAVEQALREAWDQCLNTNLVPISSLTGDELPHDQVGGQMHVGNRSAVPPAMSNSMGARPAAQPHPAAQSLAAQPQGPSGPVLVIESATGRISDDAPTQILVRDGLASRPMGEGGKADVPGATADASVHASASTGAGQRGDQTGGQPSQVAPGASGQSPAVDLSAAPERPMRVAPTAPVRPGGPAPGMSAFLSQRTGLWILVAILGLTLVAVLVHFLAG